MQIKSLYLALFANFGHQSMHQVLQGTLNCAKLQNSDAFHLENQYPKKMTPPYRNTPKNNDPPLICRPPRVIFDERSLSIFRRSPF